jgi:hypothetical protein
MRRDPPAGTNPNPSRSHRSVSRRSTTESAIWISLGGSQPSRMAVTSLPGRSRCWPRAWQRKPAADAAARAGDEDDAVAGVFDIHGGSGFPVGNADR